MLSIDITTTLVTFAIVKSSESLEGEQARI